MENFEQGSQKFKRESPAVKSYNATVKSFTMLSKLYDVSAVDFPAYQETSISARGFFEEEHSRELEALEQAQRRKRLLARVRTYPTNI